MGQTFDIPLLMMGTAYHQIHLQYIQHHVNNTKTLVDVLTSDG